MSEQPQEEYAILIRSYALRWLAHISYTPMSEREASELLNAITEHVRLTIQDEIKTQIKDEVKRQLKAQQGKALRATRGKLQGEQRGAGA